MTEAALSENLSRCQHIEDIPWRESVPYWRGADRGKILRMLDAGQVRSAIAHLPTGGVCPAQRDMPATVQGYVLSGVLNAGAQNLEPGGFFVIPAGQAMPQIYADEEAELLVIFDDVRTAQPLDHAPLFTTDATQILPVVPEVGGRRLTGFARRVLWEDPLSGADTRLLTVPAGFEGAGPNWHPVHEEILCLAGDIAPDDTRLMTPGSYLHNPAFGVHGYHEHSDSGATVLEWHDGPWSVNFTAQGA